MNLFIAAVLPVFAILVFYYMLDKFEPEPFKLLMRIFLFGCLTVAPILIVETYLMNIAPYTGEALNLYHAFVVAGFTEEVFKWSVVYFVAFRNKEFNQKLDGIVYAVFASMGFAVIENIMYVMQNGMETAILRGILSVPAHMFMGVIMGYYLSLARFNKRNRFVNIIKSIVYPIILHGIYDYILMSQFQLLLLLFIPFMIYTFFMVRKKVKEYYNLSKLDDEERL